MTTPKVLVAGLASITTAAAPALIATGVSLSVRNKRKLFQPDRRNFAVELSFLASLLSLALLHAARWGPVATLAWTFSTLLRLGWVMGGVTLVKTVADEGIKKDWLLFKMGSKKFYHRVFLSSLFGIQLIQDSFLTYITPESFSSKGTVTLLRLPSVLRAIGAVLLVEALLLGTFMVWIKKTTKGRRFRQKFRPNYRRFEVWSASTKRRMENKWNEQVEVATAKWNAVKRRVKFEFKHPEGRINIFVDRFIFMKRRNTECGACLEMKTRKRVPQFGTCQHRMCFPCLQNYIEESCNSAVGTNLECPYNPDECLTIGKPAVAKVLRDDDPTIDAKKLKIKLKKAFIRAGLLELQHVMVCPSPDCLNAEFAETQLVDKSFLNVERQKAEARHKKNAAKGKKILVSERKPSKILGSWAKVDGLWINKADVGKELKKKVPKVLAHETMTMYAQASNGVDLRKFKCAACGYSSCVVCKNLWTYGTVAHDQISCDQFHDTALIGHANPEVELTQKELREQRDKGLMKACPKCTTLIEKNQGCSHMTCSQCKYEFCWKCLGRHGACRC